MPKICINWITPPEPVQTVDRTMIACPLCEYGWRVTDQTGPHSVPACVDSYL